MENNSIADFSQYFSKAMQSVFAFNPDENTPYALAEEMNFSSDSLAIPEQIHSNQVQLIETPGKYEAVDGLVTSSVGPILSLKVADCPPVYFHDLLMDIIGLVHSGWRGTASGIIPNTIKLMQKQGSDMGNIRVYIGPSIGVCCYEVDAEVAESFDSESKLKINKEKWKVDLNKQINLQLLDSGVPSDNIHASSICTFESDQCHSYRRDGSAAGRMYAFMGLI